MSEKSPKPVDSVKLDVETILQTTEGRPYLKQLSGVSQVLSLKDSEVTFKGEQVAKVVCVGDCKSVQLFKCPNGYFIFCNKALTSNNWSATADNLQDLLAKVRDSDIRKKLEEAVSVEA